jgi:hypothetical protein
MRLLKNFNGLAQLSYLILCINEYLLLYYIVLLRIFFKDGGVNNVTTHHKKDAADMSLHEFTKQEKCIMSYKGFNDSL